MKHEAKASSGARSRLVLVFALAVVSLLAAASPAAAVTDGYIYDYSFSQPGPATGLFGFGMGLAVDQSTGDVYVSESENHRLLKFDSDGNFLETWGYGVSNGNNESQVCVAPGPCQAGLSGTAPGQFAVPTGIAVDNSAGPNQGDVYVVDGPSPFNGSGPGAVLKFDSDGDFLNKIDGSESDSGSFQHLGWNGAVSVDGLGFVYITGGPVAKFSNEIDNEFVLGSEWGSEFNLWSVTANATGTRLLVGGLTQIGEGPRIASAGGTIIVDPLPCGGYFNGGNAFDGATQNFLVGHGGEVCEFTQKGQLVSKFGAGVIGGVGGIGVNEATGNVYVADQGAAVVRVFEPRVVPDVTTGAATNLGHTSATVGGQVAPDPDAGGDVSDCHFEVRTDTSYGTNVPCEQPTPYSGSKTVSADLSGLTSDTTYHYRLVAANSIDSNAGADKTFTPRSVLGLSSDPATALTPTSARLNGSFEPNNESTSYYFEWGTDTAYGNTDPASPGSVPAGTGTEEVGVDISGLTAYTKYHYRIVATNGVGTSYGDDATFVTEAPDLPTISETAASGVTTDSATISTFVKPGFGTTAVDIEYGTDTTYGAEKSLGAVGPDNSEHELETELTELLPGTIYHFRVVATNFGGTTHGSDMTFMTQDAPAISSDSAASITQTTATLNGLVNPNLSTTTVHFEYGPTAGYGSSTRESDPIGSDGANHNVSAQLSGLAPDTTYHFRLVATNDFGRTTDLDQVFRTLAVPPEAVTPTTKKCKKGFVKRKGRCVKRRKKAKAKRHTSHATRGANR